MKTKNRDPISPKELTESELRLFKWCQQTIDIDKLDKKLIPSKDDQDMTLIFISRSIDYYARTEDWKT